MECHWERWGRVQMLLFQDLILPAALATSSNPQCLPPTSFSNLCYGYLFTYPTSPTKIWAPWTQKSSVQFSSFAQSCPTLCNPMNRSTPGLPVHHQLPEFTETHVHWVGDAIQPSHPLSSPSPPAPNPSQHQSLFHESTLRMRWPKYWSFSFSIIPDLVFIFLFSLFTLKF